MALLDSPVRDFWVVVAECDTGRRISVFKSAGGMDVSGLLSPNWEWVAAPSKIMLKYLWVLFTRDEKIEYQVDKQLGVPAVVTWALSWWHVSGQDICRWKGRIKMWERKQGQLSPKGGRGPCLSKKYTMICCKEAKAEAWVIDTAIKHLGTSSRWVTGSSTRVISTLEIAISDLLLICHLQSSNTVLPLC